MNNLTQEITAQRKSGKTKEEIYLALLKKGETVERIQEGFVADSVEREIPNSARDGLEKEDTHKRVLQIIVYFGAILIGAGVFSFIASNWQEMGSAQKVVLILFSMSLAYYGGWFLKEKRSFGKTGEALYFLANIIYGAGIFLVAQIFNIRAEWPDGFILWLLGSLAAAYALNSTAVYALAIIAGVIATLSAPFVVFGEAFNPFLMTSSLLLFTAVVITFLAAFIIRKKIPAAFFEESE